MNVAMSKYAKIARIVEATTMAIVVRSEAAEVAMGVAKSMVRYRMKGSDQVLCSKRS